VELDDFLHLWTENNTERIAIARALLRNPKVLLLGEVRFPLSEARISLIGDRLHWLWTLALKK